MLNVMPIKFLTTFFREIRILKIFYTSDLFCVGAWVGVCQRALWQSDVSPQPEGVWSQFLLSSMWHVFERLNSSHRA